MEKKELKTHEPIVLGVVVVDFNHLVGPQVEFAYPRELESNEDLCAQLPFMALPDGSHMSGEDYCYFHLLCHSLRPSTIFGISCNRQIQADELINKGSQVTRSMVQKAIVILAMQPIFGPLRTKLGMVTRAFFAQRDLNNLSLLEEFYGTLDSGLRCAPPEVKSDASLVDGSNTLYMGTSIRECIYKWRFRTLTLLKLILLQRRVMFYGYPVEHLCTLQYSLISLVPALLPHLQDAASPGLDTLSSGRSKADSLRMSDRQSLLTYMGLPLPLFSGGAFFQPYCPLQQIDTLKCDSWLIGTTNQVFKHQRASQPDVIVDLDKMQLSFRDPALQSLVSLTPADRKWMDEVIGVVQTTWNSADPAQPTLMQYKGSDDYLRARFEEYVFGLLSLAKHRELHPTMNELPSISSFGRDFLDAFRRTRAFQTWHQFTDESLCELISYQHPCTGKTTTLSDVTIRLQAGISDLNLEENLAPTRERLGAAWQAGSAGLSRVAMNWRQDLGRMTASYTRNSSADATDATASKRSDTLSALQATGAQGAAALSQLGSYLSRQRAWYGAFSKAPKQGDTAESSPTSSRPSEEMIDAKKATSSVSGAEGGEAASTHRASASVTSAGPAATRPNEQEKNKHTITSNENDSESKETSTESSNASHQEQSQTSIHSTHSNSVKTDDTRM